MTLPLRDYLAQRRSEVQASIKALRTELAELDAAEKALGDPGQSPKVKRERGTGGTGKKTLKEMALDALRANPEGADAQAILSWIKDTHGLEVARESMSPQLSRLGHEGVITRDGLTWRLKDFEPGAVLFGSQREETPDGYQPSGASEGDDSHEDIA